jgi:hypothetical protein
VIGPFPAFVQLVGATADAAVFFAGSIAFTAAATLQGIGARGGDRISAAVQLLGTVFFNISTWRALQDTLGDPSTNRVVWRPDALGSVCFLVAGVLAYRAVRHAPRSGRVWRMAAVNLLGSIAFGISAVAGYVVPATGDVLALAAANLTTVLGALCFLAGAVPLMRSPEVPPRNHPDRVNADLPCSGTVGRYPTGSL